jgi:hypothetical protein
MNNYFLFVSGVGMELVESVLVEILSSTVETKAKGRIAIKLAGDRPAYEPIAICVVLKGTV